MEGFKDRRRKKIDWLRIDIDCDPAFAAIRSEYKRCLVLEVHGLKTALAGAETEPVQAGDPARVKEAVEQLSRYLAESDAAAIDYFETAAPHLQMLVGPQKLKHFSTLIENYGSSEAHEELMAAGERSDLARQI